MLSSAIIRHGKTVKSWDSLAYEDLVELITQKSDPGLDENFVSDKLAADKIRSLEVKEIFTSPMKRAVETGKLISEILGVRVKVKNELREIRFNGLPIEVYNEGSQSIREYLLRESERTNLEFNNELLKDGCLLISHGFLMRKIFLSLKFGKDFSELTNDERFTTYFSGFDYKTGKQLSFIK